MADTDVIGIVSLLLAAGGAAYLFRARILSQRAEADIAPVEDEAQRTSESAARDQKTMPPVLRPPSEPPKAAKSTLPQTPEAKAEAKDAIDKREKIKEAAREIKETKVSRTDPLVKSPDPTDPKKDEAAPSTKPEESKKVDEKKTDAGAKKADASAKSDGKKTEPAKVAKAGEPASEKKPESVRKPAPSKPDTLPKPPETPKPASASTAPRKPAPSKPLIEPAKETPKPAAASTTTPSAAASKELPKSQPRIAAMPKNAKKQTIVGLPEPANAPSLGPPKSPAVDKLPEIPKLDIPRLDMDEDEDTEPTRVGRLKSQSIRPPVEKHIFDEGADSADWRKSRPLELRVYALAKTDPGRRRKQNEDSHLVREKDQLFVVADGMGGHKGGEFASKCAVDTIANAFETKSFAAEAHGEIPKEASELARAIQMANSAILDEAGRKPELAGMGTTLCAARFTDDTRRLFLGHVGDSRCYRIRNGVMTQMTKDHTMADYGIAGPEGSHLSRALGVWPTVPIDIIMATPELNDTYLLCSDGLTKMLTNETISAQLVHEEDPAAAVQRLVMFANAHGGKDNITVILLRVVEPGWKPPSQA